MEQSVHEVTLSANIATVPVPLGLVPLRGRARKGRRQKMRGRLMSLESVESVDVRLNEGVLSMAMGMHPAGRMVKRGWAALSKFERVKSAKKAAKASALARKKKSPPVSLDKKRPKSSPVKNDSPPPSKPKVSIKSAVKTAVGFVRTDPDSRASYAKKVAAKVIDDKLERKEIKSKSSKILAQISSKALKGGHKDIAAKASTLKTLITRRGSGLEIRRAYKQLMQAVHSK